MVQKRIAGSSVSDVESSVEHCYTLFAQADLEHDRRIAVVRSPDAQELTAAS